MSRSMSFAGVIAVVLLMAMEGYSQTAYKIMAVGDSITAMNKYQPVLSGLLVAGGYTSAGSTVTFVGPNGSDPYRHAGFSGRGIEYLVDDGTNNIDNLMDTHFGAGAPPASTQNVVMLMMGINNMNHGLGISGAQAANFPVDGGGNALAAQYAAPLGGSYLNGLGQSWGNNTHGTVWLQGKVGAVIDMILAHPSQPILVIAKIPPVGKGSSAAYGDLSKCPTGLLSDNNDNCALRVAE